MEKVKLNGYEIDFYTEEGWNKPISEFLKFGEDIQYAIALSGNDSGVEEPDYQYAGSTSEVSEDLAEKIVNKLKPMAHWISNTNKFYKVYGDLGCILNFVTTANESLRTLSILPYCTITKIN